MSVHWKTIPEGAVPLVNLKFIFSNTMNLKFCVKFGQ